MELLHDLSFLFLEFLAANPDLDLTPHLEALTDLVEEGKDGFGKETKLVKIK